MELRAVKSAYRRWAPVYDLSFGAVAMAGRRQAVEHINQSSSAKVLEIGVGTGLSLRRYRADIAVTGIDISLEMLNKARERVAEHDLANITALLEMDARKLSFPGASFDTVVAMFVLSVVPDPVRVMEEMERVVKPGGDVLVVGHFAKPVGHLALAERALAPFADKIGWHSDFRRETVLAQTGLELVDERSLPPFGIFTLMRFIKRA